MLGGHFPAAVLPPLRHLFADDSPSPAPTGLGLINALWTLYLQVLHFFWGQDVDRPEARTWRGGGVMNLDDTLGFHAWIPTLPREIRQFVLDGRERSPGALRRLLKQGRPHKRPIHALSPDWDGPSAQFLGGNHVD